METKIKNSPIIDGNRAKFHFTLHNLDYTKEKKEIEIEKDTKIFNYKDFINFSSETLNVTTETKFLKFGNKEYKVAYPIEKEKFSIEYIVNKIYEEFQTRRLEGIILKLNENDFNNDNLPQKSDIEKYIRNSMEQVGLVGDYLGKKNMMAAFSSFNTLLRKKPKSIVLTRIPNSITEIKTQNREQESISVLSLRSDSTVFYSDDYENEIVIEDTLQAIEDIKENEHKLFRSAFEDSINIFLFKTPIDLVFTSREPERKFVSELVKKENAQKLTSWIKSKNQSFYSLEYSYTKGSHTNNHFFNPDFFILLEKDNFQYISVIEIKSDNDISDENKAKNKYAIEHFKELNNQLKEKGINQKYFFNFLSPKNYSDYFAFLREDKLINGKFTSELDNDLLL